MQTEQIDEIREMFRNDDGSCKLSRSDVLRIVDKLAEQHATRQSVRRTAVKRGKKCPCGAKVLHADWCPESRRR